MTTNDLVMEDLKATEKFLEEAFLRAAAGDFSHGTEEDIGQELRRVRFEIFERGMWSAMATDDDSDPTFNWWTGGKTPTLPSGNAEPTDESKLRKFFGLEERPLPEPKIKQGECSNHDWHTVILFQTAQERCRWCDIKKVEGAK